MIKVPFKSIPKITSCKTGFPSAERFEALGSTVKPHFKGSIFHPRRLNFKITNDYVPFISSNDFIIVLFMMGRLRKEV